MAVIEQRPGRRPLQQEPVSSAADSIALTGKLHVVVWLYLLAVVVPIGFNLGPLYMTSLRLILIAMIVPLMFQLLAGRFGKVLLVDVLFILHILWVTIAMAVNHPERLIENTGATAIEFLGGYVVGRAYIRTPNDFGALCRALGVIVLLSAPFALFETMTGRPLLLEALRAIPGIRTLALNFQEARMGLERVQLGFAHPIHYGLFCSVAFSMAWVGLKGWSRDISRFLTSVTIALCGFLALSSGALLAIILQIGLIFWSVAFAFTKKRWWILFALFVLAYIVIDLLSNRTPIMVFLSYATFSSGTAVFRTWIFEWGLANVIGRAEPAIPASPWFGVGFNDWIRPYYMYTSSVDNFWLLITMRYGLPAFFTLAGGYLIGLTQVIRKDFTGDKVLSQFRLAWVFTFMGLTFTLCTVHIWTSIYSFAFFFFGAGMWLITAQGNAQPDAVRDGSSQTPQADGSTIHHQNPYTRFAQRERQSGAQRDPAHDPQKKATAGRPFRRS